MQQAIRAIRPYGGALRVPSVRGIHSTAVNPNPAVLVAESRHSTEPFSSHDLAQTRNITTIGAKSSPLTQATRFRPLGPRAKANFITAIPRGDLKFSPFESSIIFPALDSAPFHNSMPDIRVPFLPDNFHPARKPEPEVKVTRPIISTVADSATHIAAPSAIMEGHSLNFNFNFNFAKESEGAKDSGEEVMMRAFRM